MKQLVPVIAILFATTKGLAQTCCSGGVPISNNLGLPLSEAKTFQTSVSYDLNILNTLKDGRETLSDNTRKRITHTVMAQIGYSINEKLSFDALLPYIRQERELTPIGRPRNFEATDGFGDVVLLGKYRFYRNFQIGLGVKLPTGSTSEQNSIGLRMAADMQPGSGSYDIIYWFSGTENLKIRPSATIGMVTTFRSTGQNDSYFGSQQYEFGDEFQTTLNYGDQLLIGKIIINPFLGLRYRTVVADRIDNSDVPSTGGSWLFVRPGLGYPINQKLDLQVVADLPVFADLEGTQVTPTVRLNFAVFVKIQSKKTHEL